jgi:exodeoxyribonuclease III
VTLLTYNIRYGGIGREHRIGSVIARANCDIAVLQEASDPAAVERIAREAGMPTWISRRGYSLAAVSRVPLAGCDWRWTSSARHAYLDIRVQSGSTRIIGVHLRAIHSNWTERRRTHDIDALLRSLAQLDAPHVLVGDFNTVAPPERLELARLPWRLRPLVWLSGGSVQWRVTAKLGAAGYQDAYRALHPHTPGYTFPATDPHIRLDYVFVPASNAQAVQQCEVLTDDDARRASDHLPLRARLEEDGALSTR